MVVSCLSGRQALSCLRNGPLLGSLGYIKNRSSQKVSRGCGLAVAPAFQTFLFMPPARDGSPITEPWGMDHSPSCKSLVVYRGNTASSYSPLRTQPGFPSQYTFLGKYILSYGQYSLTTRSAAEVSACIVCGCMPILAALFRERKSRTFHFPSLRYFSFTSRSFRRPFVSKETPSNNLRFGKQEASSGKETGEYMELDSEIFVVKSNNNVLMDRG